MSNRSPSTVKLWRKTRYQPTFWTRSGGEETSSTTRCMKTRKYKKRKEISMIFNAPGDEEYEEYKDYEREAMKKENPNNPLNKVSNVKIY